MVGQCPSCIVRRQQLLEKPTPPTTLGELTENLNLVESIRVTCRTKIAETVPIRNARWPHLENLFFASSPELKGQLTRNLL